MLTNDHVIILRSVPANTGTDMISAGQHERVEGVQDGRLFVSIADSHSTLYGLNEAHSVLPDGPLYHQQLRQLQVMFAIDDD